jgi:hypothetical protein
LLLGQIVPLWLGRMLLDEIDALEGDRLIVVEPASSDSSPADG